MPGNLPGMAYDLIASRRKPGRPSLGQRSRGRAPRGEAGQATVEFVALLPILTLVALALGQAAVAGYAQWSAAGAARVAARAEAIGGDEKKAARDVLPRMLRKELRVRAVKEQAAKGSTAATLAGTVEVRLRVPSVLPGVRIGAVRASAQVPQQGGA